MQAMILAAGYGTRLRPLTAELPKPAVPVGNRPAAVYAIEHLAAHGVKRMVMNTHYLADELRAALDGVLPPDVELRFIHEPSLLGTGGGLANAWALFDDSPVLIMNTDIIFAPDLSALLKHHRETDAIATMVLRADPRARSFGALEIDQGGRVHRLLGLPEDIGDIEVSPYMFTGVHILDARARAALPEDGCIVRHAYRSWVDSKETVAAVVDTSPWHDMGSLSLYHQANIGLANGTIAWPAVTPQAERGLIAPGASLGAGSSIIESVVGEGADIKAGVTIERCVVWPGAHVDADHKDAVITPHHVVPIEIP